MLLHACIWDACIFENPLDDCEHKEGALAPYSISVTLALISFS